MWMHVKALESLMVAGGGKLPVNVRVIVEGEEEVGGEGIAAFVRDHGEQLRADVALVSDTEMFAPELPTLCVGLRGMIYTEIEARGAKSDLHSGMYGGAAPNPLLALPPDHRPAQGPRRPHPRPRLLRRRPPPQRRRAPRLAAAPVR